jgi:class 3 adenylate cyclase
MSSSGRVQVLPEPLNGSAPVAVQQTPADPERRLDPYVPRILLRHLAQTPDARVTSVDATVVFADISGFTALSERLARRGREGAEELTETIGGSLSTLLAVAYENGGKPPDARRRRPAAAVRT